MPKRRCSSQWPHRKSPASNRLWRDRNARVDAGHRDEIRSLARQVDQVSGREQNVGRIAQDADRLLTASDA